MENRNIYQIARESVGLTQERAAELLDISVESIRAYEGFKRIPPNKVVVKMIEIYNTQYLAYQHIKNNSEDLQSYLPNINLKDLPSAILKLQKEVSDYIKVKDDLIDITYDGVIDDSERPRFEKIIKELDDIVEAVMSLKFAR